MRKTENSKPSYEALEAEVARLSPMVNKLLEHCNIGECSECGRIVCPHEDELHFHHDGCPSCSQDDGVPLDRVYGIKIIPAGDGPPAVRRVFKPTPLT